MFSIDVFQSSFDHIRRFIYKRCLTEFEKEFDHLEKFYICKTNDSTDLNCFVNEVYIYGIKI